MANITNGRCFAQVAQEEPPLIQSGTLVLQAHVIGWIVSGCFAAVAIAVSSWLIHQHLKWYRNEYEQRYIVRILLMVPIYACVSFASYLFWNHSTPLLLIRDCYEAIVLVSFFYLLLNYLSPDPEQQKALVDEVGLSQKNDRQIMQQKGKVPTWIFPFQSVQCKPQDGLFFLQLMKWGVLQYCVIRPLTTLVAIILNYIGLYCEDSWSLGWGHVYITVIMSLSVTVAMYCLIQLYVSLASNLAPKKPLFKLFAVKAVVFLTFWQETFISLLQDFNVIKNTQHMTADNITIGICAILETLEMMLFAFLHIHAYSYKPYQALSHSMSYWKAMTNVINFIDTMQELWNGMKYMTAKLRGKETDIQARREGIYMSVIGKARSKPYTHISV